MDPSLKQDINLLVDSLKTWTPDSVLLPMDGGATTINVMHYIGADCVKHCEVAHFDNRTQWSDTSTEARKGVIQLIATACAQAGFAIRCKGWDEKRRRLRFMCPRGIMYKPPITTDETATKKTRNTKTTRPTEEGDLCGFNFTVHWMPEDQCWAIKGGYGCGQHRGHFCLDEKEVRRRLSTLPDTELQIAKDCCLVNNPSGAVQALMQHRTGIMLTKSQLSLVRAMGRNPTVRQQADTASGSASSPAQEFVNWLRTTHQWAYLRSLV
jgi:hypothetical protein